MLKTLSLLGATTGGGGGGNGSSNISITDNITTVNNVTNITINGAHLKGNGSNVIISVGQQSNQVTTLLASGKNVSVSNGANITLMTSNSRSHISRLWFSSVNSTDPQSVLSSTFTIMRDGETINTASIKLQDQDLFCRRGLPSWGYFAAKSFAGRGVDSTTNKIGGMQYVTINIPCESNLSVNWNNASGNANTVIWWDIEYQTDDATVNRGAYVHLNATKISTSVNAYSEQNLITTSTQTLLQGITGQFRGGDGNMSFQEGAIRAYLNGEANASYQSSGTEDFFQMSDFARICGPATNYCETDFGCTQSNGNANVSYYRWLNSDPVFALANMRVTWANGNVSITGSPVTNAANIDLVCWYYTPS